MTRALSSISAVDLAELTTQVLRANDAEATAPGLPGSSIAG
jgi:hypothetical protein